MAIGSGKHIIWSAQLALCSRLAWLLLRSRPDAPRLEMLSPRLPDDGLGTVNDLHDPVIHGPRTVVNAGHTLYGVFQSAVVVNACHTVLIAYNSISGYITLCKPPCTVLRAVQLIGTCFPSLGAKPAPHTGCVAWR